MYETVCTMQRDYDYFMTTSQTVYSNNLAFSDIYIIFKDIVYSSLANSPTYKIKKHVNVLFYSYLSQLS